MINETSYALGANRSCIRDLFEYGCQRAAVVGRENVYDYSLGNPSIPSPKAVNETICQVLADTDSLAVHGYTSAVGDYGMRQAIADDLNARYCAGAAAEDFFIMAGAAPELVAVFRALAVPGSEILAVAPYFPEYKPFAEGAGFAFKVVPPDVPDFQIKLEAVEAMLTEKTQAIILNSPNNPSGVVYTREVLTALADLLSRKSEEFGHPIYVISDEPYRELAYDKEVPYLMDWYDNTLVCYSYSKTLSIPGERMGYLAVCKRIRDFDDVMDACSGAARALGHICASNLYQRVIERCVDVIADVGYYKRNRDLLVGSLEAMGFTCAHPDGAFYLFMKCPIADSMEFCEKAKEYELMLVPGHDFGVPEYLRVSYCVAYETIQNSLPAFQKLAEFYGLKG